MNGRILELIEQAYVEVPHERDWDATSKIFDKEKFAELIVLECTRLLDQKSEFYSLVCSTYCDNKAEGFDEAVDMIKNHFGVEK